MILFDMKSSSDYYLLVLVYPAQLLGHFKFFFTI